MQSLILHPTDISQWHALVYDAQAASELVLPEDTESYLVFLLLRFSYATHLMQSILAIDFLESTQLSGKKRLNKLQDIGDKSLLLCGLFPDAATKRSLGLDYFSEMGQTAYLTVSEYQKDALAQLYLGLSRQFPTLQRVLQAMRGPMISSLSKNSCS